MAAGHSSSGSGLPRRHLITGGGGFLGSHLTDALLAKGEGVVALDSFLTSDRDNVSQLKGHPRYELIEWDLAKGLPRDLGDRQFDRIWHLASPASPVGYVKHQVVTLK